MNQNNGSTLRNYLNIVVEGKKTILKTLVLLLGMSMLYLVLVPPVYKAGALIKIDKNKTLAVANLSSTADGLATGVENSRYQHELERLRSRAILAQVVEDLNLMIQSSPRYFPVFGAFIARQHDMKNGVSGAWWGFGRWAWGGEILKADLFEVPDRYLEKEFTLVAGENGHFQLLDPDGRILTEGAVGELLIADIDENDRVMIKLAVLIARPGTRFELVRKNSLTAIEALQKAFSVQEISQDTDILNIQLMGYDPESLARSVNDIANSYVVATMNWESSKASQKEGILESQLQLVKENLDEAKHALNAYRQEHGLVAISARAETLLNQAAEFEARSMQLKLEREEARQNQEQNPDPMAINAQIEAIDGRLAAIEGRLENLSDSQQDIFSLLRDVRVNSDLYAVISNKLQKQRIAGMEALGDSRIVDFAVVPEKPFWPKPEIVLAIASLLGLSLGAVLVFLRYSLQRYGNNCPMQIGDQTGLSLLANISYSKKQNRSVHLIDHIKEHETNSPCGQNSLDIDETSLRGLRSILKATVTDNEGKVIMVTSPSPGMGKSFISTNMAALLACSRKRVLIIDADSCGGCLHESLAIVKQPGLTDLLAGKNGIGEVIVNLPDIGIDVIPRGSLVPDSVELLLHEGLTDILEQLKSFYNHIVIDSPAIRASGETTTIAKHCDATFLVVKEGHYTTQELEASFRCLQQVDVTPNGFIINDMAEGASYYPYYEHSCHSDNVGREEASPLLDCKIGMSAGGLSLIQLYAPDALEMEARDQSLKA